MSLELEKWGLTLGPCTKHAVMQHAGPHLFAGTMLKGKRLLRELRELAEKML